MDGHRDREPRSQRFHPHDFGKPAPLHLGSEPAQRRCFSARNLNDHHGEWYRCGMCGGRHPSGVACTHALNAAAAAPLPDPALRPAARLAEPGVDGAAIRAAGGLEEANHRARHARIERVDPADATHQPARVGQVWGWARWKRRGAPVESQYRIAALRGSMVRLVRLLAERHCVRNVPLGRLYTQYRYLRAGA